jgi:hypothetical protein
MILTIEELAKHKKVYVSCESVYAEKFIYAVYSVVKHEYRGVNKHYVKLKTMSQDGHFRKEINLCGLSIDLKSQNYNISDNLNDLKKSLCQKVKKELKTNSIINPKLLKILTEEFPHHFI